MKSSQFEAKTFGVGELIMQRKLFRVPPHQRSYAWGKEAVDEFLQDISQARTNKLSDYFIGLIVIQGTDTGEWILLDGQQRLTTVTLIFSGIRYWLHSSGFVEDAKQIDHEYLGVRRLGGDYSSRMLLNSENQECFATSATELNSDLEIATQAAKLGKSSSNRLLLNAATCCRTWVNDLAGIKSLKNTEGASRLYELARFLDNKLKVVAVEVSSEVDAYVLFESLNDRGVALSALDLIKNYILSKSPGVEPKWPEFLAALREAEPEDFLKVFWTSRYGVIQKAQIFRAVKDKYDSDPRTAVLIEEMTTDATLLSTLADDDHPYWTGASEPVRDQVFLAQILESKQIRPLVIAILRSIADSSVLLGMLRLVVVAIVRFQVVGRGRTGVVEKVLGRLCNRITSGQVTSVGEFKTGLQDLLTPRSEFEGQVRAHVDGNYSRIAYLLAEDTVYLAYPDATIDVRIRDVRRLVESTRLERIIEPFPVYKEDDGVDVFGLLGNFRLVPTRVLSDDVRSLVELQELTGHIEDSVRFINERTAHMSMRAAQIWYAEVGVDQ